VLALIFDNCYLARMRFSLKGDHLSHFIEVIFARTLKPKATSLTHRTESFFNAGLFHCAADQPFVLCSVILNSAVKMGFMYSDKEANDR